MKRILLSVVAGLAASVVVAQNYKILDPINNNNITNSDVYTWGDQNGTLEYDVHVVNQASTAKNVKVKRMEVSVAGTSTNYFCWTVCYAPNTSVSPSGIIINPGDTANDFHGYYAGGGTGGESIITYVFFDANNVNDSSYVRVHYYSSPTGITEITGENKVSAAYPNPAANVTTLNYSLKSNVQSAKISLYNMLGDEVKEIKLDDKQGTLKLHVEDLTPGIYFYSLVADSKVITTKRLVISH